MRRSVLASLFVALCLVGSAPAAADPRTHVVAAGESLSGLAARYEVSVERLRALNDLEGDTIQVGQELVVEGAEPLRYRTVPGDTLGCIASRYGVPVATILRDNPSVGRRVEAGVRLVLRGGVDPRAADEPTATVTYEVQPGETLSALAERFGVSIADLAAANPEVDPDRLLVGAQLTVPGGRSVHRVARGETLSAIAGRYGTDVETLRGLNGGVRPDRLRVGAELVVPAGRSSTSVGAPTCGFIRGGVQLGEHPGYVLRNPDRAWATARTARRLRRAFDGAFRAGRDARVRVHDLSLEGGGPIDDHRSHQSGRDVDVTYYRRGGCGPSGCPLERRDPDDLDVRRQWRLFRQWLRRDEAEAIYVDYALQEGLYREARRRGATREQLEAWFQYPRGRFHADGVVRHFPNHRDHFHVRFRCAADEPSCE